MRMFVFVSPVVICILYSMLVFLPMSLVKTSLNYENTSLLNCRISLFHAYFPFEKGQENLYLTAAG